MLLDKYYTENAGEISFTRQQACDFAKKIAGDYNPLHDADNSRFCVPGDLLFSLLLTKCGLSQKMRVSFSGMVVDGMALRIPDTDSNHLAIVDDSGKELISIEREGEVTDNQALIESLTRSYVEFSGKTFPHVLVPLMEEKEVMINPSRPLVIYDNMSIDLQRLDIKDPRLEMADASLEVKGKRGSVCIGFNLRDGDEIVGRGEKHVILSGLRPYEQDTINELIGFYNERKEKFA